MFYNRTEELTFLENKFGSKQPELLIFWGRRRVGKTHLLREFCTRKQGIFLMATSGSSLDNLESFSNSLADYFNDDRLRLRPLARWDEFFLYLNEKIKQRTVIVIDEYPYLVENNPALSSILQKYWDLNLSQNSNLMLIINGSAISMMEKETLEYRSPLYGRRTGQWFLEAFDVIEANEFFGYKSLISAIESYVVTSGIPYYCQILNQYQDIFSAIKNKVLSKGEVLYQEVDFLLLQEFKTPRSYFSILKAIAQGAHKFGDISSKTGYDKSNLTKYLYTLESLKLIRREVPITEPHPEKSKKGLYLLNDNFIKFWFQFVFPYLAELEAGESEKVLQEYITPKFDHYVSQTIELVIIDLMKKDFFELDFKFERIGRYWDKDVEIDFLGETRNGVFVIGEIKWTNSPCNKEVYFNLVEKAKNIETEDKEAVLVIVSKSGFAQELEDLKGKNLKLVDLRRWAL